MDKPTITTFRTPSKELEKFCTQAHGIKIVPTKYNGSKDKILQRDSGSFVKWITKNNSNIEIDYDPNFKKILLHNNEFWLPLVYLSSDTSVQIYLGLVVNFVYDKLKGVLKGEREKAKVNFSFISKQGENYKEFNYSGDIKGLESFSKTNINKFFED